MIVASGKLALYLFIIHSFISLPGVVHLGDFFLWQREKDPIFKDGVFSAHLMGLSMLRGITSEHRGACRVRFTSLLLRNVD